MRRTFPFLIFFTIFFSLSLLLHYYIFFHMSFMLRIPHDLWFWVGFVVSSVAFILAMVLKAVSDNIMVRIYYIITSIWTGVLFMLLFVLIGYDVIRFNIRIDPYLAGQVIVGLLCILIIYGLFNARLVRTRKLKLPAKGLGMNLRVVHISDIHFGSVLGKGYLTELVERTNALNPDVVFITGDLADGFCKYTSESFTPLNALHAPVYFSIGNHEYFAGLDGVLEYIACTKLYILRNTKVDVGNIQIVGIDDTNDQELIAETLATLQLDPNRYTIMLHHRPVALEVANKYGVNLMLAGHTHGGQLFPFTFIVRLRWRRFKGLHKYKGTYLNTSTGAGTWGPPLRLGSNSEIVLIELSGS